MSNSFPELPTPPESSSDRNRARNTTPPSRRKILNDDEKIALLVAFTTIGGIFWWTLGGSLKNAFNLDNWQNFFAGSNLQETAKQQIKSEPNRFQTTPESVTPTPIESEAQPEQFASPEATQPTQARQPRKISPRTAIAPPIIVPIPAPQTQTPPQPSPSTPEAIEPTPPPAAEIPPTPITPQPPATPETPKTPELAFNDVPNTFWAYPFIEGLRNKQLITGISESNFEPDKPITRAQMASLIDQAFDLPSQQKTIEFKDLPVNDPATNDIEKAIQKGFMRGYTPDSFRPQENIPRYQVLVALATGLNLKPTKDPKQTLDRYDDTAKIPKWALNSVAAATEKGLVVNYPNTKLLNPDRPATRAEAAAMMYQALSNLGKVEKLQSEYIVP
ncbi:MAG: S-layer homology domain-containing protein [Xenococcaceae cyanobacterium]